MIRHDMVDSSGTIKDTVNQCNQAYDNTYQHLLAIVRRLKHTCQVTVNRRQLRLHVSMVHIAEDLLFLSWLGLDRLRAVP